MRILLNAILNSYKGLFKVVSRYWNAYGGLLSLVTSPYLHASILIAYFMKPLWSKEAWWDIAISVAPNILGFSLAGYAIWLALGDESFRRLISGKNKDGSPSPFMQVNASFVHFMLLQVMSLLIALFFKASAVKEGAHPFGDTASMLGFTIFVYSLLCVLAATFAVLRISSWYEMSSNLHGTENDNNK